MTTNNAINVGLSGTTGSGNYAGSTSASFTTPTLGAATATSIAFSPTTGGLIGTTAADSASSGTVGEFVTATVTSGSGASVPTTNTAANVTSISLSAGDWDVIGNVMGKNSGDNLTVLSCWISTTSATAPDQSLISTYINTNSGSSTTIGGSTSFIRINISGTTTVYLSTSITFSAGTQTASGSIFARRAR